MLLNIATPNSVNAKGKYLTFKLRGFHTIGFCEIKVKHHSLSANDIDEVLNVL